MKNKILAIQSLNTDLATLFLRLLFGCLFINYGFTKLMSYNEFLPKFPDLIGIGSTLSFILVIFAELFCGFFVAVGFLTRLTIIPIFITMIVVFFIALASQTFQEKTLAFVFLILSIIIFLQGSGKYSIDRWILKIR